MLSRKNISSQNKFKGKSNDFKQKYFEKKTKILIVNNKTPGFFHDDRFETPIEKTILQDNKQLPAAIRNKNIASRITIIEDDSKNSKMFENRKTEFNTKIFLKSTKKRPENAVQTLRNNTKSNVKTFNKKNQFQYKKTNIPNSGNF